MRRIFTIFFLLILIPNIAYSQDGFDIRYLKSSELNESLIGKFVHFDFNNRSFLGKKTDNVELKINQKLIKFTEIRNDDGYNNWFSQQSLISEDKTLQISKFQIRIFDKNKVYATAFLNHIKNNKVDKTELVNIFIPRNKITEILVDSKQTEVVKNLNYNAIGCTCAQWGYKNKRGENEYFYLEPINKNLIEADKLWNGTNLPLIVKVTGNLISENDYPEYLTDKQLNKGAEKGKVFRYTKIEILKK